MNIVSLYPCPFDVQDRHDISAALCKGEQLYAYEEDKLSTVKQEPTAKFPERSLFFGFRELRLPMEEVDLWVFPTPSQEIPEDHWYFFFFNIVKAYTGPRDQFAAWLKGRLAFVPHHIAHSAVAVYTSEFDSCAFLSMDGGGDGGDFRNMVFGTFQDDQFNVMGGAHGLLTLASFHAYITDAIGELGDNYKTTGLASYGTVSPQLYQKLRDLFTRHEAGWRFERARYKPSPHALRAVKVDGYRRVKVLNCVPSDTNVFRICRSFLPHTVAATGERLLQDLTLELVGRVKEQTLAQRLVLSGGLFQNVAVNRRIADSGLFREVHVSMASSDAGLALGQLLYERAQRGERVPRPKKQSAYIGPSFSEQEIGPLVREMRIVHTQPEDLVEWAVERLVAGKVVGWFQGRAEHGPRSLGNRSILADPRDPAIKARVNQLLKKREWFMPYAPAILEERAAEWVEGSFSSPYMQFAFRMRPEKRAAVPAAVHVDGTSRVQTVNAEDNPLFHRLISRFYERTGVPMLLNTSFNRHGIATISAPRQALDHFLEGCVDALAVGPYAMDLDANRRLGPLESELQMSETVLLARHSVDHFVKLLEAGVEEVPWQELLAQLRQEFGLELTLAAEDKTLRLGQRAYPLSVEGLRRLSGELARMMEEVEA